MVMLYVEYRWLDQSSSIQNILSSSTFRKGFIDVVNGQGNYINHEFW